MKHLNQLSAGELEWRLYWLPKATILLTMVLMSGFVLLAIEPASRDTLHLAWLLILIGSLAFITGWYSFWLSAEAAQRYNVSILAGICQLINKEASQYPS